MSNYKFNVDTLYDKTDNGLDILKHYLNGCNGFDKALQNDKFPFQFRPTDETASSYLVSNKKNLKSGSVNYWRVKDFGGDFYTPIAIAMEQSGLDFYPCLKMLYERFDISGDNTFFKADVEIKTLEASDKRPLDWFNVVTKPHTAEQLQIIGTYVTEALAKEYDFFAVEYYEKVFMNKKTNQKTYIKVSATESFPIFCYMPEKKWCKTYAPFSKDKTYKHGYLGKKPERYVYGLERLKKKYESVIAGFDKDIKNAKDDHAKTKLIDQRDVYKIQNVIVATGGSDGLNIASLDYNVIWYNSESEQLSFQEYEILKTCCANIYNLPDVDASGIKYGYEVAERFWQLKSIWLPKEKLGANGKDFRDWIKYYKKSDLSSIRFKFNNLLNGALKTKFFDVNPKSTRYTVKTSYLHYFLKIKGFHLYYPEKKYTEKTGVQEFIFIKITNHIVEQFFPNDIRKFCETYLIEKGQPIEVIDLIKNTDQFNESKLLSMDKIVLDFKNFTEDTQMFFFKNNFATVSQQGVELKPYKDLKTYVWDYRIIDKNIFPTKPHFRHYKDEAGNDRVEILEKDSHFMNYLINGSRMFWRKELEEPFTDDPEAKKAYHDANRFNLSAESLTMEERLIQEKHFLNKCFGIGYLLHRYKIESFAKFVYIMDDAPKESEEDSNGRSGKSILLNGIDKLLNNHYFINGKSKNITTNSHLLDGFTKENDYIRIEDIDQYLGVEFFYNWVTGPISVNPKTKKPYNVEFADAGKLAATSNFGIGKINQSTLGRLFFISYSDYYHVKTDKYMEERKVSSDFDNKDLFSSYWTEADWNRFFNLLMECNQLYLINRYSEITAPQNNIHLTNIQASMGENFMAWCDSYFTESMRDEETLELFDGTLNRFILRQEIQKAYSLHAGDKYKKTSTNFKKSLNDYCKMKGWILNPTEYLSADKKTIKKPHISEGGKRDILEFFYIRTFEKPKAEVQTNVDDVKTDLPNWL